MQVIIIEGILMLHFKSLLSRAHMKVFVDRCTPLRCHLPTHPAADPQPTRTPHTDQPVPPKHMDLHTRAPLKPRSAGPSVMSAVGLRFLVRACASVFEPRAHQLSTAHAILRQCIITRLPGGGEGGRGGGGSVNLGRMQGHVWTRLARSTPVLPCDP